MLARLRRVVGSNLRYKLLLRVVLPMALVMPAVLGAAIYWSQQFGYAQLYQKVNTDLSVAHDVFQRIQLDFLAKLEKTAESYALRTAFEADDDGALLQLIELLALTAGFDHLHLTDTRGNWRFHAGRSDAYSKPSPLLERTARLGVAGHGVEVYSREDLLRIAPELARRVQMPLVPTRRAAPSTRETEDRALVLRAVYPIKDRQGSVVALLDAGVLLNRNFAFVDQIRDLVYGKGSVPEDGWGTVTVVLDDVRISTNVPLGHSERALGTRVSRDVREVVLERGEVWIDRAFVVNDWYVSAYEPIVDVNGVRVGMLQAGFLEAPFRSAYLNAIGVLALALFCAVLAAAVLMARGARSIVRPIEAITAVVRATQAGQQRRIGEVGTHDEIGELARQFDAMLEQLNEKNRQIRQASDELELKVEERTRELQEKNARLQQTIDLLRQTRRQLATAEKLAALGELTAGVAHEINNPTAVILGNLDVLAKDLGPRARPVQTEIDLIIEQVDRIRAIVDKLLRYSRPAQYAGEVRTIETRSVIEDTLLLVRHELARKNVHVHTALEARATVQIDPQELQQVLVNLLVNAAHAVSSGGRIEVSSRDWDEHGAVISVLDFGHGIPLDKLGRVFDPFFTSNSSGTGLGLSVSYGIIRRYGGRITVASEEGNWTRFDVYLRSEPVFEDDQEFLTSDYADVS